MPAPRADDLVDLVDDEDHVVGTVARADVFTSHAGFRVVHVLVSNSDGDLLLQRVGRERDRSPGRWGSSVAGYVYAGEQPEAAAVRRLREEIGLATPVHACGQARMDDDGATKFVHVYCTSAEHASIREPDHIDSLRFWSLAEVSRSLAEEPDAFTETFPVVLATAEIRWATS